MARMSHFDFAPELMPRSPVYSVVPVGLFLLALILVSAPFFLIFLLRDSLVSAVKNEPLAYIHIRVTPLQKTVIEKKFTTRLPDSVKELALVGYEAPDALNWFVLSKHPLLLDSRRINGVYWTAISANSNKKEDELASVAGDFLLKKPWYWFFRSDYGWVSPAWFKKMAFLKPDFKPDLYFKARLDDDYLKFGQTLGFSFGRVADNFFGSGNLLSRNTQLASLLAGIKAKQLYFSDQIEDLVAILESSLGEAVFNRPTLSVSRQWQGLLDQLKSAKFVLFKDQSTSNWLLFISPIKEVTFGDIDDSSRLILAEVWPQNLDKRLKDGTFYQETLADSNFYKWNPDPGVPGVYKLSSQIMSQDIFSAFTHGIWLTNNKQYLQTALIEPLSTATGFDVGETFFCSNLFDSGKLVFSDISLIQNTSISIYQHRKSFGGCLKLAGDK